MKKTPTVFERDWEGDRSLVINQVHPGCEWVLAGEGWPTLKLDGTCCAVRGGRLYKRRELRDMDPLPDGYVLEERDPLTQKSVGWVPVDKSDKWHMEAWAPGLPDGTYELVGPKVQGNPEHYSSHALVPHQSLKMAEDVPRDFDGLRAWLAGRDIEGIVFHHPDGRMAKIKLRDFGLKRAPSSD